MSFLWQYIYLSFHVLNIIFLIDIALWKIIIDFQSCISDLEVKLFHEFY